MDIGIAVARHLLLVSALLLCHMAGFGQQAPAYRVIFGDDFSGERAGTFPKRWFTYPSLMNVDFKEHNGTPTPDFVAIKDTDGDHILVIHSHGANIPIAPDLNTPSYLTDAFNAEFDAFTEDEKSDIAVIFYDAGGNYICYIRIYGNRQLESVTVMNQDEMAHGTCPDKIKNKEWHHYRLEYKAPALALYIDGEDVYSIPDCNFPPASMAIAANTSAFTNPYVAFGNFKITTGNPGIEFNKIITEKKFATHAILFDFNKAIIKQSASGFMLQLAGWLQQNPGIKLEIDGHTDGDGDPAANLKLSQARAAAVMNELVKYGISKDRLTAKGYGATKPVQPNDTPQGKENNRRVEFIKTGG